MNAASYHIRAPSGRAPRARARALTRLPTCARIGQRLPGRVSA
jgi:hypothetical protein